MRIWILDKKLVGNCYAARQNNRVHISNIYKTLMQAQEKKIEIEGSNVLACCELMHSTGFAPLAAPISWRHTSLHLHRGLIKASLEEQCFVMLSVLGKQHEPFDSKYSVLIAWKNSVIDWFDKWLRSKDWNSSAQKADELAEMTCLVNKSYLKLYAVLCALNRLRGGQSSKPIDTIFQKFYPLYKHDKPADIRGMSSISEMYTSEKFVALVLLVEKQLAILNVPAPATWGHNQHNLDLKNTSDRVLRVLKECEIDTSDKWTQKTFTDAAIQWTKINSSASQHRKDETLLPLQLHSAMLRVCNGSCSINWHIENTRKALIHKTYRKYEKKTPVAGTAIRTTVSADWTALEAATVQAFFMKKSLRHQLLTNYFMRVFHEKLGITPKMSGWSQTDSNIFPMAIRLAERIAEKSFPAFEREILDALKLYEPYCKDFESPKERLRILNAEQVLPTCFQREATDPLPKVQYLCGSLKEYSENLSQVYNLALATSNVFLDPLTAASVKVSASAFKALHTKIRVPPVGMKSPWKTLLMGYYEKMQSGTRLADTQRYGRVYSSQRPIV